MTALPDHLHAAAAARTADAATKASDALSRLTSRGLPVTFAAVAREAGISTDFLYKHTDLRIRIERHRAKSTSQPPNLDPAPRTSAAIRALSTRLEQQRRQHRTEINELREALAIAQGENLHLRRQLSKHEPDRSLDQIGLWEQTRLS